MNDDNVIKNAVKQIKDLGVETVKEFGKAGGQITKGMSAGELLGDINNMSDEELQKRKMEEEKKKKEEEQKLKAQIKGNDLEGDMKKLREKEERESADLAAARDKEEKKRQEQLQEEQDQVEAPSNPHKQKKKRGGAFLPNDKKTQTAEYSKKPD